METAIAEREGQLQVQAESTSEECTKLRGEVEYLERDLADVRQATRRQILEIQKETRLEIIELQDAVHKDSRTIQELEVQIAGQRDEQSQRRREAQLQAAQQEKECETAVSELNGEIDVVRRQLGQIDRRRDAAEAEAKETAQLLLKEINERESMRPAIDSIIAKQEALLADLRAKLAQAEERSAQLNHELSTLIHSRTETRGSLTRKEDEEWQQRIQSMRSHV
jgi:chromosome segregation ATPase